MIETVSEHCKHIDCRYRTSIYYAPCCGYMLITGKPRNCDISKCDKYSNGKRILKSTLGGMWYDPDDLCP